MQILKLTSSSLSIQTIKFTPIHKNTNLSQTNTTITPFTSSSSSLSNLTSRLHSSSKPTTTTSSHLDHFTFQIHPKLNSNHHISKCNFKVRATGAKDDEDIQSDSINWLKYIALIILASAAAFYLCI